MPNRRSFVVASAAGIVAATLPGMSFAQRPGTDIFSEANLGAYAQGLLTQANFERLLGSLFMAFVDDERTAYMRLKSVAGTDSGARAASSSRLAPPVSSVSSFFARFDTGGMTLGQGTYVLDHGRLGRFAVFLVPGVDAAGAPTCTATFTHFAPNPVLNSPVAIR